VIGPAVWGRPTDPEVVRRALEEEIPQILDYLEAELPPAGPLFGPIGLADVAIASFFRNAAFARFSVDAARWPRTAGFVDRTLAHPGFARLRGFEEVLLKTPIARHREALAALGAPLTAESLGAARPRPGILRT
jgi:glutathione S-transferase